MSPIDAPESTLEPVDTNVRDNPLYLESSPLVCWMTIVHPFPYVLYISITDPPETAKIGDLDGTISSTEKLSADVLVIPEGRGLCKKIPSVSVAFFVSF